MFFVDDVDLSSKRGRLQAWQGRAEPTQAELDKDCVNVFVQWLKPIWSRLYFEKIKIELETIIK